ncbi:MAG: rRNA adenine N-6-methyltransferase family protein [archaeon]
MKTKDNLDQHFMIDTSILYRIVELANLKPDDIVLEIGPGTGNLTKLLAKKAKIICVEKDCDISLDIKNTEFHNANVLDVIETLKFNKIVANIPFNISEPLFKKLFKLKFELAVLTSGMKFYDLLMSEHRFGIVAREFFNIELIQEIPKSAFKPRPRVKSALIKLIPKENDSILKNIILLDDKKLKNAILKAFEGKETKKETKEKLKVFNSKTSEKRFWELNEEEFTQLKVLVVS